MKWLDEKGRLGGVINLFDLLALLLVAFLIGYYWFQAPAMAPSESPQAAQPELAPAAKDRDHPDRQPAFVEDIQFVFRDLDPTVAAKIRAGDKDATHPNTEAEIVEVLGDDRAANIINLGDKKVLAYVPGKKRMVRVRMRIRGLIEGETFFYKDQPLKRGRSYLFVTPKYTLVGEALRIDDTFLMHFTPVRRWIRISARAESIENHLAQMIREGDRALPPREGAAQVLSLEVRRILRVSQSRKERMSPQGQVTSVPDPERRDVDLVLECLCAYDRTGFHYGLQAFRAGDTVSFQTLLYALTLRLRKIEILPMDYSPRAGS
ncbi:MAG: DUF4330 family protein [Candidatus Tectomicrobia bacterium]|nr:DUF4330 family protein [Candidatus Tectomicrobia bacterium]